MGFTLAEELHILRQDESCRLLSARCPTCKPAEEADMYLEAASRPVALVHPPKWLQSARALFLAHATLTAAGLQ